VAAAFGGHTWRNTTIATATSPFEFGNVATQTTATLDTGCGSGCHILESEDRRHWATTQRRSALTTTPAVTVTMTTVPPTSTPMHHLAGCVLCSEEANRAAQATGGIAHPYQSVKSSDEPSPGPDVAFITPILDKSLPNASIYPALCVNEGKVSSNAASLDFVLNDCTNIHILIGGPAPANVSITSSDAHLSNLASMITTLLPYVEVCGLLTLIWEIGRFVHAKVYKRWNKRWNKRSRAPVQEREGLHSSQELFAA
jgi:hypothetical protein